MLLAHAYAAVETPRRSPVDLADSPREIGKQRRALVQVKQMTHREDILEAPVMVKSDRDQLSRLFLILIDTFPPSPNRIRFNPRANLLHSISLRTSKMEFAPCGPGSLKEEWSK